MDSFSENSRCPECQAPLSPGRAKGLCPRCLLLHATLPTEASTHSNEVPGLPTSDEVAAAFPQLEILGLIGRGGMGVVYRARQKSLGRVVALKLLATHRDRRAGFAERFAREARALAALNHPNIVTIHDFGFASSAQTSAAQPSDPSPGFYFLLMEFVDGVNLRQALQARRFTPEQALAIVPPLCAALQYAHDHGVVHRDIKPENLLLDRDGRIKIADFGIAKLLWSEERPSSANTAESPNTSNSPAGSSGHKADQATLVTAAGTPGYMAPEQRTDPQLADHRVDIYALGVVFYELLTGELPKVPWQPPSQRVQVDVRIDEIVLRALAVKPEQRYATAEEFRTQLGSAAAKPTPVHLLKSARSTLTTPQEIDTTAGQLQHHKTLGQLVLDTERLTHSVDSQIRSIPLAAIRDVGIVHFPRSLNPLGLTALSVVYELDSKRHHILLMPRDRRVLGGAVNHHVREWHAALREAVRVSTGMDPGDVEAAAVQLKGSASILSIAVLYFGFVGAMLGFFAIRRPRPGQGLFDFVLHPTPWILLPVTLFALGLTWILLKSRAHSGPPKPRNWFPSILVVMGLVIGTTVLEKRPARADRNLVASRIASSQADFEVANRELQDFETAHGETLRSENDAELALKLEQIRLRANLHEARRRSETELTLIRSHDVASDPLGRRQLKSLSFALLVPSPLYAAAFLLRRRRLRIATKNSTQPIGWRNGKVTVTALLATGVLWILLGPLRTLEQPYNLGMNPSFEVRTSPETIFNETVSMRFEVGVTNNPILLTTRFENPPAKDGRADDDSLPSVVTKTRLDPGSYQFQHSFVFPTHASAFETHRGMIHDIHASDWPADWELFRSISSDGRLHVATVSVGRALPYEHPERVWWTSRLTRRDDAHWKQLEVEWTIASPIASQLEAEFGTNRASIPMLWDPVMRENRVALRHRLIAEGQDRVRWIRITQRGEVATEVAMNFDEAAYHFLLGVHSGGEASRIDTITLMEWKGKTEQIRVTDAFWDPNLSPVTPAPPQTVAPDPAPVPPTPTPITP